MATEEQYLSVLVALNAALLLILAGLAKKQLDWKRPRWLKGAVAPTAAVAYVAAAIFVVVATR